MDWVTKILPFIGTALGGPLGGAAVTAIGNALDGRPYRRES